MLVPQKTGVENYTTALALALDRAASASSVDLFLYCHAGSAYADSSLLGQYTARLPRTTVRAYKPARGYRAALSAMAVLDRLDLLHMPSLAVPLWVGCPILVTFHDASWLHLPDEGKRIEGRIGRQSAEDAVRRASAFIAVSENTKRDLCEHYGIGPVAVSVVHHGVDAAYRVVAGAARRVSEDYGLARYILAVGTVQFRKNLARLLDAYNRLRKRHSIPHALVVIGRRGWGAEQVTDKVAELGLDGCVRFLDYVPDKDMPGLYNAADLLVYPSLYEGFGLPLLEAMACGTVVATSDTSSLPEIAGDAALYFDPTSVREMAAAMHAALTDSSLRNRMRARGLHRVQSFTWDKTARETLHVYRSVSNARGADEPSYR